MTRSATQNLFLLVVFGLSVLALPAIAETAPSRGHARLKAHAVTRSAAHPAAKPSHGRAAKRSVRPAEPAATRASSRNHAGRHANAHAAASIPASRMRHGRRAQAPATQPESDDAPQAVARAVPAVEYSTSRRRSRAMTKARWRRSQTENDSPLRQVHLAMPAPMRGSYESLVHQNEMADADGLERILDDSDLESRIGQKSLVPVPVAPGLQVNQELPENRRYCRPWTAHFLSDLAQAHSAHFPGAQILVTSAVRTVEYQRHLRLVNGNAAAAEGDVASPHLTGGTVDIAKHGLTQNEIAWLRNWLLPLQQAGKIDVEEEFKQSCFHISVYKAYAPDSDPAHRRLSAPGSAEQTTNLLNPKGR